MIRLVVADDDTLVRDGLRAILELAEIEVVAEAGTGAQAVAAVRLHVPDVVLMDIRMPEMSGIEASRRISQSGVDTRVLILTTFGFDRMVYEAMVSGASGFLLKDAGRERIVAGVRTVAEGEQLLDAKIARRLVERFVRRPPADVVRPEVLRELSERELEVMRLVARGLTNTEIAERLAIGTAAAPRPHIMPAGLITSATLPSSLISGQPQPGRGARGRPPPRSRSPRRGRTRT